VRTCRCWFGQREGGGQQTGAAPQGVHHRHRCCWVSLFRPGNSEYTDYLFGDSELFPNLITSANADVSWMTDILSCHGSLETQLYMDEQHVLPHS
jgi:hypothetical protein